ncbi:MAG: M20/M25/M40 family metallo-hydrolase [Lentisphaeria bacterium]|nr:M20/M25/M40 family metallo-hydrolase [Lentisphaeria bacterium]
MLQLPTLFELITLHSTPGDETDVNHFLTEKFESNGLQVSQHGPYAMSATFSNYNSEKPTILICAHMDSPGFIVESVSPTKVTLVPIGGVHFEEDEVQGVLKTIKGLTTVTIIKTEVGSVTTYNCERVGDVQAGDRVCYQANPQMNEKGEIHAPFLDNRVGCFMLVEIAKHYKNQTDLPFNLVFGATGTEEFGGFGASVLANQIKPDYVICLDATYTDKAQKVELGQGPVITLSDRSVILSMVQRQNLQNMFYDFGVYVQYEVYNYSGTDARAFPAMGLIAPVIALLLPTTGNHEPIEVCDFADLDEMFKAIVVLIERSKEYELF